MTVLDQLHHVEVPLSEEPALIRRAQHEDEEAKVILISGYVRMMRSIVKRFERESLSRDDLASAALEGFLEALAGYDTERTTPLGVVAKPVVMRYVARQAAPERGFAINEQQVHRFRKIMAVADGDPSVGAAISTRHNMSRSAFLAVYTVLHRTMDIDSAAEWDDMEKRPPRSARAVGDPTQRHEDEYVQRELVRYLLSSVITDEEKAVVEPTYGFYPDYEPVPMTEIAHRLGISRATAYRRHDSALSKMRKSLRSSETV